MTVINETYAESSDCMWHCIPVCVITFGILIVASEAYSAIYEPA